MEKNNLVSLIEKYYLDGTVESAIWNIKDNKATIKFTTQYKNLVGIITSDNFDLDDCEIGIYNTSQFLKFVRITDSYLELKLLLFKAPSWDCTNACFSTINSSMIVPICVWAIACVLAT